MAHNGKKRAHLDDGTPASLQRVRLDRGGYDSDGKYFGVGEPIYRMICLHPSGDDLQAECRASSREEAAAKLGLTLGKG